MTITAIASMYLLSVLGVEGNNNSMVFIVGLMGLVSLLLAGIVNWAMLVQISNERQQCTASTELPSTRRSVRAISSGKVEKEMFATALI